MKQHEYAAGATRVPGSRSDGAGRGTVTADAAVRADRPDAPAASPDPGLLRLALLDVVPNHCSSAHPWFRKALANGPGSPERARF
ncbi:hypothetical protein ACWEQL_42435, partial [Kitasatospora sp. NPDC004240]